jgi:hypothetical protein
LVAAAAGKIRLGAPRRGRPSSAWLALGVSAASWRTNGGDLHRWRPRRRSGPVSSCASGQLAPPVRPAALSRAQFKMIDCAHLISFERRRRSSCSPALRRESHHPSGSSHAARRRARCPVGPAAGAVKRSTGTSAPTRPHGSRSPLLLLWRWLGSARAELMMLTGGLRGAAHKLCLALISAECLGGDLLRPTLVGSRNRP